MQVPEGEDASISVFKRGSAVTLKRGSVVATSPLAETKNPIHWRESDNDSDDEDTREASMHKI